MYSKILLHNLWWKHVTGFSVIRITFGGNHGIGAYHNFFGAAGLHSLQKDVGIVTKICKKGYINNIQIYNEIMINCLFELDCWTGIESCILHPKSAKTSQHWHKMDSKYKNVHLCQHRLVLYVGANGGHVTTLLYDFFVKFPGVEAN